MTSWFPLMSIPLGLLMAFLIGLTIRFAKLATSRSKQLKIINENLKRERAERRNIEEALQRTQFMVDRSGEAMFWINSDAQFFYVNEAACQSLGYSADELLSMKVSDIDPDWPTEAWPDFWPKLQEQKIIHIESRHQKKDGTIFPVEIASNYVGFQGKEYTCAVVRDISERKRAESALRESEAWFKTLSGSIPQMVWTAQPDGSLDYVNQRVSEYSNRSADQILGWKWTDILHPDDLPKCLEQWSQAREQGIPYEIEFRLKRGSDQTFHWFIGRALPFRDETGQIIKWFGTNTDIGERKLAEEQLRDIQIELEQRVAERTQELVSANAKLSQEITERKNAEEMLRESESRLRAILEHSPSLIFIKDLQGRYLHVNPQFEKDLRVASKDIIGKTDEEVFPPRQATQFRDHDRQVIQAKTPMEFEEVAEHKDGVHTSFVIKFPLFDSQGELYGICGITHDITERKRAEEEQLRLLDILENANDLVGMSDNEGRVLYLNQAGRRMVGRTDDEDLGGTSISDYHPARAAKQVFSKGFRAASRDGFWVAESALLHRNGREIPVSLVLVAHRSTDGTVERFSAIMRDLTERKRLEEDILLLNANLEERVRLRTAELEAKNAELERFTYTVSHDLKSPLVTIQGFLRLVKEDIHAGHADRLEEDLQRIEKATRKMQQLLNELLELSRVGRLLNPPEPVPLNEIVQEAMDRVTGAIASGGVRVEIASGLPIVMGDRIRIVEVVQNLIDNAVKFMGEQPDPKIEIGVRQECDESIFYVRDNGIGIEARHHEKVFGLFEQLDCQKEGTGIGLTLVKRIIEMQGGRIWVESKGPGHGSSFCFVLPLAMCGSAVNGT